jgi:ABC-type amino acid transport substrate-binding protein
MKRKILPMASLMAALVLLGSCGESSALISIRGDKAAHIGTVPFEAPLFYQKGTEMVGPDAELATRIVASIKSALSEPGNNPEVSLRYITRSYSTLIQALENEEAHFVLGVFGVSESRKERVSFSTPYYTSQLALAINPVLNDLRPELLRNVTIGVREATVVEEVVKQKFPNVKIAPFKTVDDAVLAVRRGEVDGIIDDRYMLAYSLDTVPGAKGLELVPGDAGKVECAVAVWKGDEELLKIVNDSIAKVQSEGLYAQWTAEHVGERLAHVEERHAVRIKQEQGPRNIEIRVSKDANYNFDIYKMANLSFQLTNSKTGEKSRSSRIRFRRKVGSSSATITPGNYTLSLPKFGFKQRIDINKDDPDTVTFTIRLKTGGQIIFQKS